MCGGDHEHSEQVNVRRHGSGEATGVSRRHQASVLCFSEPRCGTGQTSDGTICILDVVGGDGVLRACHCGDSDKIVRHPNIRGMFHDLCDADSAQADNCEVTFDDDGGTGGAKEEEGNGNDDNTEGGAARAAEA